MEGTQAEPASDWERDNNMYWTHPEPTASSSTAAATMLFQRACNKKTIFFRFFLLKSKTLNTRLRAKSIIYLYVYSSAMRSRWHTRWQRRELSGRAIQMPKHNSSDIFTQHINHIFLSSVCHTSLYLPMLIAICQSTGINAFLHSYWSFPMRCCVQTRDQHKYIKFPSAAFNPFCQSSKHFLCVFREHRGQLRYANERLSYLKTSRTMRNRSRTHRGVSRKFHIEFYMVSKHSLGDRCQIMERIKTAARWGIQLPWCERTKCVGDEQKKLMQAIHIT